MPVKSNRHFQILIRKKEEIENITKFTLKILKSKTQKCNNFRIGKQRLHVRKQEILKWSK